MLVIEAVPHVYKTIKVLLLHLKYIYVRSTKCIEGMHNEKVIFLSTMVIMYKTTEWILI
jgi:hypothetical protein